MTDFVRLVAFFRKAEWMRMKVECVTIGSMTKAKQPEATKSKRKKNSGFVLGSDGFIKISAVEEIKLTAAMKTRAADAKRAALSAEEYRRLVVRSHRKA